MMKMFVPILWAVLISGVISTPINEKDSGESDLMATIYSDCLKLESLDCIKYKVFSYVDKMLTDKDDITLSEGITVVKTSSAEEGAPRSIDSTDVDTLIFDRLGSFLKSHSIKIDFKGSEILSTVESAGRNLEDINDSIAESRGKKKKSQKMMGPLMMAIALKAAALLPLALGAIALIAGKALLVGKIALVISAIIGLKKLLGGQKHVTYEVVAHPHHSSSSSHVASHDDSGHGSGGFGGASDFSSGGFGGASSGSSGHGWARSLSKDAQQLAYRGQIPA